MMKTKTLIVFAQVSLLAALPATAAVSKNDDLPKTPVFARYEAMTKKSPFAVATAVIAVPPAPNFAKDLYVSNAAKLFDESVATLSSSTDKNFKEYVSTKGPNKAGYGISNFEWSDRVGATKVTISKDGQFATLTFNQALMTQTVPNVAPQPIITPPPPLSTQPGSTVPPVPQYNANVNAIKPAPIPTLPTPPPRVRGVIQRNPVNSPPDSAARTDEN